MAFLTTTVVVEGEIEFGNCLTLKDFDSGHSVGVRSFRCGRRIALSLLWNVVSAVGLNHSDPRIMNPTPPYEQSPKKARF